MSIPYDPSRARDLASAVSQIVPVLLLAGLAVPLLQRSDEEETNKSRAARHLVATVLLIGLSGLTEYAALYGVYYRLVQGDVHLLMISFALTTLIAGVRVLMPIIEHYSDVLGMTEKWMWLLTSTGALGVFLIALYGMGS
jgi:hypothetical protein